MENLKWIFDGIGTEIISLIFGAIVGVLAGYKFAVKKSGKQVQKAKSGAKQKQEMMVDNDMTNGVRGNMQNNIRQTQKAGKNSEQVQIGGINNGKR